MSQRKPVLLIFLNSITILLFLLVCLTPFTAGTSLGWLVSIIGMGFIFLLFAIIFFLLIWLFRFRRSLSKWMVIINLVVLLLGFQQIRVLFGFNFFGSRDVLERAEGIRLMSWNVSGWDINNWDAKGHQTFQPLMFDLIEQTNPDILLLQEFFNCTDPVIVPSYVNMLSKRGYPYYYFSPHSITVSGKFQSGLCILSKYPLVDTAFVFPESAGHSEGYQRADVIIQNKKIRVFNTHLESAGMNHTDLSTAGKIEGSGTIFSKLKYSHQTRIAQAMVLKKEMNQSPHPLILGGDVGELPNSTTYFYLRKGLKDAFNEKGSGIGRTFAYVAPNLRIDYLFVSPELKVNSFFVIPREYSVHYPIISDISE